jgi:hypothetical protein
VNRSVPVTIACLAITASAAPLLAQQTGQVPANSVILCEKPDFVAPCVQVDWDPATRHKLVRQTSSLNFEVSSIAVGKNVEVWVFSSTDFFGTSAVIKRNRNTLKKAKGNEFYPYPWSIERQASAYVESSDGFYPWSKVKRPTGAYPQDWDDKIDSFIIYPRGKEPQGVLLLKDTHKVPVDISPMDDDQTSLFCPMPEDRKRESRECSLQYLPHSSFEREARMIRVPPAVGVVLFEQRNCHGDRLELPGVVAQATSSPPVITSKWPGDWDPYKLKHSYTHWYDLKSYGFEGKVSSLRVRVRDWLHAPERDSHDTGARTHRAPPANPTPKVMAVDAPPVGPAGQPKLQGRQLEMTPAATLSMDHDTNRAGHDYKHFELQEADPELCRAACAAKPKCRAYTFVKPGIQGERAQCWLKSQASPPEPAPCCVSGAKLDQP